MSIYVYLQVSAQKQFFLLLLSGRLVDCVVVYIESSYTIILPLYNGSLNRCVFCKPPVFDKNASFL